jgi:hypothetical protein
MSEFGRGLSVVSLDVERLPGDEVAALQRRLEQIARLTSRLQEQLTIMTESARSQRQQLADFRASAERAQSDAAQPEQAPEPVSRIKGR